MPDPILSIRDLTVEFKTEDGIVQAVSDVSYDLMPGEVLGIVGESGSGKSVSMLSILGLSPQGRIPKGVAEYKGEDLLKMSPKKLRDIRGGDMAMIFQDPMTSLNPVLTVGNQIMEALQTHNEGMKDDDAQKRAIQLLEVVGVPSAERRIAQYPHEFSGGMRQRAMIAMADDRARRDDPGPDRRGAQGCPRGDPRGDRPDHPRSRTDRGASRSGRRHVRGPCRRAR